MDLRIRIRMRIRRRMLHNIATSKKNINRNKLISYSSLIIANLK